MNSKSLSSSKMVATKHKNKVLSCSTPERCPESPSRDSDSICDSEAASPVPFLCTQDGAEGETDVVWNFYTPKAEHVPISRVKDSTPLSRKSKKIYKPQALERPQLKRRTQKSTQLKTELFQDLIELNQNVNEIIARKSKAAMEKPQSGSEEDIFSDSDRSPKSCMRTNTRCLRRNVLSSKFSKPEQEALESDDSMNEFLIKASQVVEDNILNDPIPAKRTCIKNKSNGINETLKPGSCMKMDNDSMDAILSSIKLESPLVSKAKRCESPRLKNDSFDSFVGNLNDSILERLTQIPIKSKSNFNVSKDDWVVQDIVLHNSSPSTKTFGRYSSMPESPTITDLNKPSTSGMVFGRYNSMPFNNTSPLQCTPDEIRKKHQLAREKLNAKRLLPFTSSQTYCDTVKSQLTQQVAVKKSQFQPKVASTNVNTILTRSNNVKSKLSNSKHNESEQKSTSVDLKQLIEKKRQEALMKLRRKQPQNKS